MLRKLNQMIPAIILTATTGLMLSVAVGVEAAGGVCSNCHVMHASEGGVVVDGPNDTLLRDTCLGCHTTDNTDLANNPPGIYDATPVGGNHLAAGNFGYSVEGGVGGDQTFGHNPSSGVLVVDTRYDEKIPPGWVNTGFAVNGQVGTAWTTTGNPLTCAGTYGCHGLRTSAGLDGAHHDNATGSIAGGAGASVGQSYRFLKGISGFEASDYELAASAADGDHNVYYAVDRANDNPASAESKTMSYLCAECHGIFHSGSGNAGIVVALDITDPWIRHPSDIVIPTPSGGNGSGADFDGLNAYDPGVPLGSSSIADGSFVDDAVDDRIVMCLSCHRAHASPYVASLRWDYANMIAGDSSKSGGCFYCHNAKND